MIELLLSNSIKKIPDIPLVQGWNKLVSPSAGRYQSTSIIYDGYLYIFGGNADNVNAFTTVDICKLSNQTWKTININPGVALRANGGLIGNKFYIYGGFSTSDTSAMIEFTLNKFNVSSRLIGSGSLGASNSHGMTAKDNTLYVLGGNGPNNLINRLSAFNPNNSAVSTLSGFAVRYTELVKADNGLLYTYGGQTSSTVVTAVLRAYNSDTNTWTNLASSPQPRSQHGIAITGNELYTFGGISAIGASSITGNTLFQKYDILTNTWTNLPIPVELDGPGRRTGHTLIANDGVVYLTGGRFNGADIADAWAYVP